MKKLIAMLLVLVMVFSLVACGNKNDNVEEPTVEETTPVEEPEAVAAASGALAVLEKIWTVTSDNEKFPAMGGDANNMIDGAPGVFDHTDVENLSYMLLVPAEQTANIDDAAALFHGMMLNNFTCGAFHVTGDVDAFADAMYEAVKNNQWMCGFPESMIVAVVDNEYVLMAFGINDIMKPFVANVKEAHQTLDILYLEDIA